LGLSSICSGREVRVPGVTEAGHFFNFYSCSCGRVECVRDEAPGRAVEACWPEAV
jgi:hypothetical protein